MSNLKYESLRIDSKTVVFIRANPGEKETTDGSGLRVNFIRDWCTFPEVVSSEKWHVTKNFKFAVTQRREDMTSRRSDNFEALITFQGQESRMQTTRMALWTK